MSELIDAELVRGWDLPSADDPSEDRSPPTISRVGPASTRSAPWRPDGPPSFGRHGGSHLDFSLGSVTAPRGLPDETAPRPGADEPPAFPEPGAVLSGFRLLSELGRGAFARVYLAEQAELADRPVALKVSRALGREPQILAQLQHTHIVPIYSLHDDPATGLRLLCVPYLGGANLADVLDTAGARLPSEATGRSLVEALDRVGHPLASAEASLRRPASFRRAASRRGTARDLFLGPSAPGAATRGVGSPTAVRSLWGRWWARFSWAGGLADPPVADPDDDPAQPARRFLRHASYIQAAVWIAARLAEGLEHAHGRGLLHRDLKPSNILIAADGTPMLLDFNLSAETDEAGPEDGTLARLGGTLPYMAPEHLDAFNPLGSTPPEAVDERSDIYAMGLILFEMVAGHHPFSDPPAHAQLTDVLAMMAEERLRGAPSVRASNSLAPWSLDAILRKCLDSDPDRRYARAGDLAKDLRRFLDDRPLAFAPEPSLRERAAKWARRHPRASSSTSVALVAMILIAGLVGVGFLLVDTLRSYSARHRLAEFQMAFNECQLLLNTTSGPAEHLGRGLARARSALGDYEILRRDDWATRDAVRRLAPGEREALREQAAELVLLAARAQVYLAERLGSEPDQREALERAVAWLDQAERFDPSPSAALYGDRARYRGALGRADEAAGDRAKAASTPPRGSRDYYLLGSSALAHGRREEAERLLLHAVSLDPKRFWARFALGLCHADLGRNLEAAGDFNVCTALEPQFAWPHLNRGLALARAGRLDDAKIAYDRALEANPRFAEALVDRALAALELGDGASDLRDLERAIELGRHEPPILAARAEALARLGRRDEARRELDALIAAHPDDPSLRVARGSFLLAEPGRAAEARADFERVLARDPSHARARLGLAYVLRATDPRAALGQLDRALDLDPSLADARQLRALVRGRLGDPAASADVDLLIQVPTPHRLYNAACALALLAKAHPDPRTSARAVDLLHSALDAGLPPDGLADDPDLTSLRDGDDFRALLARPSSQ
jgi:serine/threonine protein kinase/Tfp pilus assembly protein PilF